MFLHQFYQGVETRSKFYIKIVPAFKTEYIFFFLLTLFFLFECKWLNHAFGGGGSTAAVGAYPRNLFVRALKFHKSCT